MGLLWRTLPTHTHVTTPKYNKNLLHYHAHLHPAMVATLWRARWVQLFIIPYPFIAEIIQYHLHQKGLGTPECFLLYVQ